MMHCVVEGVGIRLIGRLPYSSVEVCMGSAAGITSIRNYNRAG